MRFQRLITPVGGIAVLLLSQATIEVGASPAFPTAVYRCVVEEVVTFSDRPCDAEAKHYAPESEWVSTVEVAKPFSPSTRAPERKVQRVQSGSIAAAQAKHKEECARIEESLREVRSKLRAGYDVKQGERLKDRDRKLKADLRSKRC
jgi:hypothetical protein